MRTIKALDGSFCKWMASSPLATILKTFFAVLFAGAVTDFSHNGMMDFGQWQTWVIAALVSVLPMVLNWLNPEDTRYGRGSSE